MKPLSCISIEPKSSSATWTLQAPTRSSLRLRNPEGELSLFRQRTLSLTLSCFPTNSTAASIKCDVSNFDQQVEMFELAIKKYGSVDIVVPNAGVNEIGFFSAPQLKDGKPVKPSMKTMEINLFGVLYSASFAALSFRFGNS